MGSGRFVADVHLARLAKYLRLLGFDTLYYTHIDDDALMRIAKEEDRVILTKDRGLAEVCERSFIVRSNGLREQLREVMEAFGLRITRPFSRCMVDNGPLVRLEADAVRDLVPPKVRAWCEEYWRCEVCGRIYWQGSHWERMRRFIADLCGETPPR